MPRFFSTHLPTSFDPALPARVVLDHDEAHHARKVLRLDLGEKIEIFDGKGAWAHGVLESWDQGATVMLKDLERSPARKPVLDLAVAVPKGPRADDMVNQLGQVGVDRLIPLRTARSVVDPRETKIEKFVRASVESAKQSGRNWVMTIDPVTGLDAMLKQPHDLRLIADPRAGRESEIADRLIRAMHVLVLIGPEGGWTPDELERAQAAGCIPWRLGPHVMRIETAAVAAGALVRYLTSPK